MGLSGSVHSGTWLGFKIISGTRAWGLRTFFVLTRFSDMAVVGTLGAKCRALCSPQDSELQPDRGMNNQDSNRLSPLPSVASRPMSQFESEPALHSFVDDF